jgi:hypothetical protein
MSYPSQDVSQALGRVGMFAGPTEGDDEPVGQTLVVTVVRATERKHLGPLRDGTGIEIDGVTAPLTDQDCWHEAPERRTNPKRGVPA